MHGYLEIWGERGPALLPLGADRTSIGRASGSDVVLEDAEVSQLHAVVERYGTVWCVRDVGSSNGTFVSDRIVTERRLRSGDEIRVGTSRLVFRARDLPEAEPTAQAKTAPRLTAREHEVLVALCAPLVGGQSFAQPASIRRLATELCVSEAAVRFHLANLYDKFGIYEESDSKRVRLANEAVRRRAVTMGELREAARRSAES